MTIRGLLRRLAVVGVTLMFIALAGRSQGFAQSFTFTFSTQATCIEDTAGFTNLEPNPLPGPSDTTHFIRRTHALTTGTSTFSTDGTFTTQDQTSSIHTGGTEFSESQSTCTGTFGFNSSNQTLNTSSSCNFQDTIPNTNSGTITGLQGVLQLTPGEQLVRSGPHPPVVETVNVNLAGGGSFTIFRICTRAGSSFFLH